MNFGNGECSPVNTTRVACFAEMPETAKSHFTRAVTYLNTAPAIDNHELWQRRTFPDQHNARRLFCRNARNGQISLHKGRDLLEHSTSDPQS
jgi:hypothetical protein